jgi:hypothetical protein
MSKNLIQRIIAAIWPKKRAAPKQVDLICLSCGRLFQGKKGRLTCSKACKNAVARKKYIRKTPEKPALPKLTSTGTVTLLDPEQTTFIQ